MAKLTITRISRQQKTSKAGKPFESVGLQAQEYGDQWLNGFGGYWNKDWAEGSVVEAEVEEVESGGKRYLNFKKPDPVAALEKRVAYLESKVLGGSRNVELPEVDVNAELSVAAEDNRPF